MTEIPDFRRWNRNRLELLLQEYRDSLQSLKFFYKRDHGDARLYEAWIKAIENELMRRDANVG